MGSRGWLLPAFVVSWSACSDDSPHGPIAGDDCGFEADTPLAFTSVQLVTALSDPACPEVTAEDVNGADEPDCSRALDGCELVVSCSIEVADGLSVHGTGHLLLVDGGRDLAGRIDVQLGSADCHYDVVVVLE